MKIIHTNELKKRLRKKLYSYYIFLGEDFFLSKQNQNLILNFAYQKGFSEKVKIDIEKNQDLEKIIVFYKKRQLFFQKTILIVNFIIDKLNVVLIKKINEISYLLNTDILMILKFNKLSLLVQKNKLLYELKKNSDVISCFTPYNLNFINWVQFEIKEKNINIDKKALSLLCKYYEGNTLFTYKILELLLITWPNTYITVEIVKNMIVDFFVFYPSHWINSIFQSQSKKAIYSLKFLCKQKYEPLLLIRHLQKYLLKLIYLKRKLQIKNNIFSETNHIWNINNNLLSNAAKKITYKNLFKAIQILVKIEINIKKKHNNFIWNQLQELTLILI